MADRRKTKAELLAELDALRDELARLEAASAGSHRTDDVYQAVVENSNQGLVIMGAEGILYANSALAAMTGYSLDAMSAVKPEEMIARVVHPDDRAEALQRFRRRLGGPPGKSPMEIRIVRQDGETRWLELFGVPIDFRGKPALQVTFTDVTERVLAEQTLRETTDRLDGILDTATDVIITIDAEQNITLFNKAAERAFGYAAEEIIGKPHALLLPQRYRESHHSHVERFALEEDATREMKQRGVLYGLRADGTEFPIDAVISKVTVGGQQLLTVMLRDITERLRVEQVESEHRLLAEALRDTSAVLNSTLKLDEVLERIMSVLARVVHHDASGIMLIEPSTDTVRPAGWRGVAVGQPGGVPEVAFKVSETANLRRMRDTGLPMTIPDLHAAKGWIFLPGLEWTRAYVGAPIRVDGRVIGFFSMFSAQPGYFTDRHAGHLQAFADQAAIAIKNARLYEQTHAHAAQLEALHRLSLDITAELDLDALLSTLVASACELLDAGGGGIYLYRPERGVLEWVVSVGSDREPALGTELHYGEGLSGKVWASGKPMLVDHYSDWEEAVPAFRSHRWSAVLGAPLRWGDEFLGVINADADPPRIFSEDDVRLLSLFADQAAIAVKNARLYEQVQQQAEQLETLHHVALSITAELDLDALLQAIVRNAISILNVHGGGVHLYRPERDALEWVVGIGEGLPPPGILLRRGEGLSGRVLAAGKPLRVDRYHEWEGRSPALDGFRGDALLGAPIMWGDEFLGSISAIDDAPRTFSDDDERLLSLFADQAAIAIKNARLFEQVQRHASELEVLRRVTLDISAELDLDALLNALITSARKLLGAGSGGIYLYRPERDVLEWAVAVGPNIAPPGAELKRGEGVCGKVLETLKPLLVEDYATWDGKAAVYDGYVWDVVLGVPIMWGDEFLGAIAMNIYSPATFTQRDVDILSLFADQAAIAIKNARLYEQVQRNAAELEALRRVTLDITAELNLEALLQALAASAFELLKAEGGGIYLYRPERDLLEWVVSIGQNIAQLGVTLRRGEGLSGRVWETGQPLLVENYSEWEGRSVQFDSFRWEALLGVPIVWGEEFLGVIAATARPSASFTSRDADLLSLFAAQAATAIQNARLYDDVRRHAEALEIRVAERTAELNAANVDLKRLGKVKDEFVSNVSHELRTPIANLKVYHKLLETAPREKHADYLAALRRETVRLERIVEDLLRLSVMDQHQMAFNPGPLDLNELARQYVSDRFLLAESQGINLGLDLRRDLPPVSADESLLGQVLSILLNNALNYTQKGGHVVVQTIVADEPSPAGGGPADCPVGLSVRDDGPGVEPDELERLFERFFRGKVGRRSGLPGTGLGLSIAREIVLRHGGRIEIESEGIAGRGAAFTVWLPLER